MLYKSLVSLLISNYINLLKLIYLRRNDFKAEVMMSGVGPFYINIHNVTFGKRWTVPKIDPFLWTAGKVLVPREE